MTGKKYTAVVEFCDPEPSTSPKGDVETMLKYGWKHQEWSTDILGEIKSEEYEED